MISLFFKIGHLVFFSHCFFIFLLFQVTPLTHSILNVCKRVIVVLAAMLYFRDHITAKVTVSLGILVLGFVLYEMNLGKKWNGTTPCPDSQKVPK